jgi:uncharacterized small protein (DUF1192 family)
MTEEILTQEQTDEQDLAPQSTENEPSEPTVAELNERIASLTKELEAYKQAKERQDRISEQLNEFSELFPEVSVRNIPDDVWEDVKRGNSLAAAYSIYERRITEAARRIERINAQNAERSAGVAGKNLTEEFFSADDVRKMSPSEVRANYAKIRRSMEKWN